MSGKSQYPVSLGPIGNNLPGISWQSTDPRTGFLPLNANTQGQGSVVSGNPNGVMSGTSSIWSSILDVSRMDAIFFELIWNNGGGTASGVLSVLVSDSAINWNALSFTPQLPQPTGTNAKMGINISVIGFKYVLLEYDNTSGSGILNAWMQARDWN